jgi:hypothetical protein
VYLWNIEKIVLCLSKEYLDKVLHLCLVHIIPPTFLVKEHNGLVKSTIRWSKDVASLVIYSRNQTWIYNVESLSYLRSEGEKYEKLAVSDEANNHTVGKIFLSCVTVLIFLKINVKINENVV